MKTRSEPAPISTRTLIFRSAWLSLVLGIACAFAPGHAASFELVARDSTGSGDSEEDAIVAALVEAVRQGGLTIESEKSLRTLFKETESGQELTTELNDRVRSRTKGTIHAYEILSLNRVDQRWIAKLRVTLAQYRSLAAGRTHLPSIAVLPFRAKIQGGADMIRACEQKLVTQLVQSGRFQVVDREFAPELDAQDARLRSGNAPETELLRLGQQLGADYTVVGEINRLDFKRRPGANMLDEVNMTIEYRIIDSATREVRGANSASLNYSNDMLEQLGLSASQRLAQEHLLNSSAFWVVTDIMDVTHPTKPSVLVMQVSPDVEYALYANGVRMTGTGNEFVLPADRDLTLQVIAKNYESAERKLRLSADTHERMEVKLNPGPGVILEAARTRFNPTGYASSNGKNTLVYSFFRKVAEGERIPINYQGSNYLIEVANINAHSYKLIYKGQSVTEQIGSPRQNDEIQSRASVQHVRGGRIISTLTWSKTPRYQATQVSTTRPSATVAQPTSEVTAPQPQVDPAKPKVRPSRVYPNPQQRKVAPPQPNSPQVPSATNSASRRVEQKKSVPVSEKPRDASGTNSIPTRIEQKRTIPIPEKQKQERRSRTNSISKKPVTP